MKNLLIGLLSVLFMPLAQAANLNLFQITTEYDQSLHYEVGVDISPAHAIDRIYLIDTDGGYNYFTLDQLQSFVPAFVYSGTTLVQIKITQMDSPTSAMVELKFLKNALTGASFSVDVKLTYQPSLGAYQVVDNRTGKVIHTALLTSNKVFGKAVGIADMQIQ